MDYIVTPRVPDVLMQKGRRVFKGTLYLMTHHLLFNSDNSNEQELWIAYSTIQSVDLKSYTNNEDAEFEIHISCKNFLYIQFTIFSEKIAYDVFASLKKLINITSVESHYAFFYKPVKKFTSTNGWSLYDPIKEYKRLGVGEPGNEWRITAVNKNYTFSRTYPQKLFVPASITDNVLNYAVKFRSKGRIPVLSYIHRKNGMSITRSSQPMVGIKQNRSMQDEKLVEEIFATAKQNKSQNYKNLIVDARSSTNAMANIAMGAGYENVEHYKGSRLEYLKIENIHVVRDSLNRLIEISRNSTSGYLSKSEIDKTGWLKHIHTLLEGSLLIIKTIDLYNSHVLVHCSDGWDRTSQLVAISEVCLDPYYRTIEGFEVLVEKDWISFGHKFSHRCGLLAKDSANLNEKLTSTASKIFNTSGNKESTTSNTISNTINAVSNFTSAASKFLKKGAANITNQKDQVPQASSVDSISKNSSLPRETSPIFTQFLDCIYQLWIQNPTQFEFNDDFLVQLNTHVYSSQFGTFLFNSEYERRVFRHEGKDLSQCTYSVWDWFNSNKEDYINPLYEPPTKDSPDIVRDSPEAIDQFEKIINNESLHSLPTETQARNKVIYPKTNERVIKYWSKLYNRSDDDMNGLEQTHGSSSNIVNESHSNASPTGITKPPLPSNQRTSSSSITTPLDYNSLAATITDTSTTTGHLSNGNSTTTSTYPNSFSYINSNPNSNQSINSLYRSSPSSNHSLHSNSHDSVYSLLGKERNEKPAVASAEELDILYGSPFQSLKSVSKLSDTNSDHTALSSTDTNPLNISTTTATNDEESRPPLSTSSSSQQIRSPEYYTQPDYSQIKNNTSISSIPQMATTESTFVHPLE